MAIASAKPAMKLAAPASTISSGNTALALRKEMGLINRLVTRGKISRKAAEALIDLEEARISAQVSTEKTALHLAQRQVQLSLVAAELEAIAALSVSVNQKATAGKMALNMAQGSAMAAHAKNQLASCNVIRNMEANGVLEAGLSKEIQEAISAQTYLDMSDEARRTTASSDLISALAMAAVAKMGEIQGGW